MKIKTIEDMKKLFNEGKLTHFLVSDKCKDINYHAFTYSGIKLKIESFEALYVIFEVDENRAGYMHFYDIDLKETEKLIKGEVIMTKNDLKDGMVVEIRDMGKYLVLGESFLREGGYNLISSYKDDLKWGSGTYYNQRLDENMSKSDVKEWLLAEVGELCRDD